MTLRDTYPNRRTLPALTEAQVRAIRADRGVKPAAVTAAEYDRSQSTISAIQRNYTYRHIPETDAERAKRKQPGMPAGRFERTRRKKQDVYAVQALIDRALHIVNSTANADLAALAGAFTIVRSAVAALEENTK